ncbi:hypothetical protein [Niabella ginsenosidivorans]|nr:hypothetical protein [Niabella ginsenosidivorans]
MFKLFRRRRDKPSVMHGVFQKLGQSVERSQRRAANYLNQKTATLSRRQTIAGLVLFCVLFGGSSAFTIWHSLRSSAGSIRIQNMKVPAHTIIIPNNDNNDLELTGRELYRIKSFRRYLDSLQQTKEGKAVYDSIARYRPGLLDSLAFIEQAYQLQLKTNEDEREK